MTEQNKKPVNPAMPGNKKPAARPVPAPAKAARPAMPRKPGASQKPARTAEPKKVQRQGAPVKANKAEKPATAENQGGPKKISKFTKGLLIWLVVLTVVICVGLVWFNGFTAKYEELYQASLPHHQAEKVVELLGNQDVDTVWNMMTEKPKVTEFENDSYVKKYVEDLVKGKELTYKQTEDYSENAPEYYICTTEYIIAKLKLAEDETQKPKYGFKAWKIGSVEFYTAADNEFKITIPETYTLSLNGKEVPAGYKTQEGIELEENKYLKPHAELPKQCVYEVKGLYEEPVIKVTDAEGNAAKAIKDKDTGAYKVVFGSDFAEKEAVEKFAIQFTTDFANFISQDAGKNALDKYFPKNSQTLKDIKRNSSRDWYTKHGKVDVKNEQIKEFICYTKDIVYVETYLEQHMEMYFGSKEREVVKTTARLYLCRINGEWKVAGIKY